MLYIHHLIEHFGNKCFELDSNVIPKVLASLYGNYLAQLPWYCQAQHLEHCLQIFRFSVLIIFLYFCLCIFSFVYLFFPYFCLCIFSFVVLFFPYFVFYIFILLTCFFLILVLVYFHLFTYFFLILVLVYFRSLIYCY